MTTDRFSAQGELDAMVADLLEALKQHDAREALNQWHFNTIGYRPDDEPDGALQFEELEADCREYCEAVAEETHAALPDNWIWSDDCRQQFRR